MSGKPLMSYKARRRWSLVVRLLGLPAYVVLAVSLVDRFERPSVWVELLIYVALGVLWALPLRFVFSGVGKADPGEPPADDGR